MSEGNNPSPRVVKSLQGKDIDKNKLLLLGLNLLNKGLKLPYAVVRPQAKAPTEKAPTSQLAEKLKSTPISPQAPQKLTDLLDGGTRKRKREDDSEVDKREKRYLLCVIGILPFFYCLSQENDE